MVRVCCIEVIERDIGAWSQYRSASLLAGENFGRGVGSRTFTWSFKFRPPGRLIHCELLIIVSSSWTAVNNGDLIRWPDAAVEKYLCGTKCASRQNNSSGACCDIDYAAISTFRLGPTREHCSLVDSIICRPFMGDRSQEYERRLVMSQQPCPWTSIQRGSRNIISSQSIGFDFHQRAY